jgi:hypothetical protein
MHNHLDPTPGHERLTWHNLNPDLVILSACVDEMDAPHFDLTPIVAWEAERLDGQWIADRPIGIQSLEGDPWCLWDRKLNLCYSPVGIRWIGGIDPKEAKAILADAARKTAP